jgi:DnaJ-class molecular chaperone
MAKGFLDGYKTYDTSKGFGNPKKWEKAFYQRMNKEDAEAVLKEQTDSPYFILSIKEGATKSDIKAAFRKLISEWHPDKNPERVKEAEEMSKKIIAAYTILTTD